MIQARYQPSRPVCLLFLLVIPCLTLWGGPKQFKNASAAQRDFAELLKISRQPPAVSVTVKATRQEDDLLIEDISWPAADNQQVIAFVIRPIQNKGPLPAIICLHGTGGSRESETAPNFGMGDWTRFGDTKVQKRFLGWSRELSRRGYLTLTLTQRGLDSRTPDTDQQAKDLLVRGRTLMGAIVQEIRQAVTHLETRNDVDPKRIGMTGMSFGGITTFYTWLVDDRIAAAAPICGGVGSVDVLLKIGHPNYHGYYWWIPDMLTVGDQGDFAAAMAPRPLMLWAPTEDIGMPKEGVERFLNVARPAYEHLNAGSALVVHRQPGEHSFTIEAFNAMEQFFQQYLKQSVQK